MEHLLKRELKVYDRNLDYNSSVPEVRLIGVWLKELGFLPGDKISVEYIDGKLVIEKIPITLEVKEVVKKKRS